MGSFFSREQSMAPQVMPGFEFAPGLLQQLARGALGPGFQGPFAAGLGRGEQALLQGLSAAVPQALQGFGQGLGQLANIAGGGLADAAAPGLQRLLDVGGAGIREQAALTGNQSSSGALQDVGQFASDVTSRLATQLAPLQLQAAQGLASAPGKLAPTLGIGRQAADLGIQRGLQESQFQRGLAPQTIGALGGLGGVPTFQPTTGPSKFESLVQAGAPIASAAVGNPAKFGGAKGGASGGTSAGTGLGPGGAK